jgi:hypothetical protein
MLLAAPTVSYELVLSIRDVCMDGSIDMLKRFCLTQRPNS